MWCLLRGSGHRFSVLWGADGFVKRIVKEGCLGRTPLSTAFWTTPFVAMLRPPGADLPPFGVPL